MLTFVKKYFAIKKYEDYGELMGDLIVGVAETNIHHYLQIKEKYIKLREELVYHKVLPVKLADWARLMGGWSKKYPKLEPLDAAKLELVLKEDELSFREIEQKYYLK